MFEKYDRAVEAYVTTMKRNELSVDIRPVDRITVNECDLTNARSGQSLGRK